MKKFLYFALILSLIVTSCRKSPGPPLAEFSVKIIGDPEVGKEVLFVNTSKNAVSFDWDFGDGYGSSDAEPVYVYNSTGSFIVTLTAIGEDGDESQATVPLDIMIPTLLVVEVREWNDETVVVPDASVILYESLQDWKLNDPNLALYEGFTDINGVTVFANLDPYVYFVDVWEENHDNWDFEFPVDGILYIQTPSVMSHQINWFVAWVDIVDHGKSMSRGSKDMVIKKIERKVIDPKQPAILGTEGWQELYNKRANKATVKK